MLKKVRNQKGFTLVEVIVVAVIVAILAAVAVPLYNGYIRDSQRNVAENLAGTIASALAAGIQQGQVDADNPPTVQSGVLTIPGTTTDNTIKIPTGYTVAYSGGSVTVTTPRTDVSPAVSFK